MPAPSTTPTVTPPAHQIVCCRTDVRIDGIDLLRGLAIFLVLMNHVNMRLVLSHIPYTRGLHHQLASSLVWNGQLGVQIFFAISGFLITSTALRRWSNPGRIPIAGFYRIRFARIAPLLLALLALLSLLHLAGLHWGAFSDFVVSPKTGGLPNALFAALTFHINWLEATRGYLPGNWDILWSLSVEEIFYLAFPLLSSLLFRGRLRWIFFTLLLALIAIGPFERASTKNPVWQEYSYFGGMDAIALGCLTALVLAHPGVSQRFTRPSRWIAGVAGSAIMIFCLCFGLQAERLGLEDNGLEMSVLAFGTCLVIALAAHTGWRSPRWLSPLRLLGQSSYEVYLSHMFVVYGFFNLFVALGKPLALVPALFAAVILIAGILGAFVARTYSEPMNRRLRRRAPVAANVVS